MAKERGQSAAQTRAEAAEALGKERAEIITVNDGSKQINVTRNAYNAAYKHRGFVIGELEANGGRGELGDNDENLTPQQKAAKTRAANKAAEESGDK